MQGPNFFSRFLRRVKLSIQHLKFVITVALIPQISICVTIKNRAFKAFVFGVPDLCLVFGLDEILLSPPNLEKETHVQVMKRPRLICRIYCLQDQAGCVNLMRRCPAPNLGYSTVGQ